MEVDKNTNQLVLAPNEKPLTEKWKNVKITRSLAYSKRIKIGLINFLCFAAYAGFAYLRDKEVDFAMVIFFLPWLLYIFTAYRGLDKYLLSIFIGLLLILVIYPFLLRRGIITKDGVVFIYYARYILDRTSPGLINGLTNLEAVQNLILQIFSYVLVFEAVLLMLRRLFKRKQVIQIFLTDQNIYLRQSSKGVFFSIIWTIGMTILTPININNYRELRKKFQYRKATREEGKRFDHARIARGIIPKVKMSSSFNWIHAIISSGFIILGILVPFLIVLVVIGGIWGIFTIRNYRKKLRDVKIKFSLGSVTGSWILVNPATEISFLHLNPDFAPIFLQYND